MELARHRSNLCQRTRIARGLGIVRSSNATFSERPIPFVSTRVGGQADQILSRQKSAAALERGTADVSSYADRRRMGSRGKVRRPCSAQCAQYERDELFVKSQASRFQKNQNQPAGPVSVRFAPVESLTIWWNNGGRSASRWPLKIEQNK